MVHQVVKPEKIAATAAVLLEEQLVVPAVFRREGIDQYKGAADDTINVVVEGVLPYRTYGWRNDRQTEALGSGLEFQATEYVLNAPYAVTLGIVPAELRKGLIRARATMNKLRVPTGQRTMLIGTDWEAALLEDEKLNLAQNVGEAEAVSALREATLGRRYGFSFVVAQELPPTMAVAMVDSAFIFATGAPSVPQSVPFGATASHNGVALRWIRDYDSTRFQDRSIFNTYKGFRHVTDILVGRDETSKQAFVGDHEHFVRAIKLTLGGTDSLPNGKTGRPAEGFSKEQDAEMAGITGLGAKASATAASRASG